MNRSSHALRIRSGLRRGFTLIEAALATVIIGVGVVAMMQLLGSCTRDNGNASHMTTAMLLASHMQEILTEVPFSDPELDAMYFGAEPGETLAGFDDIDDFDGQTFSPPIDVSRSSISELSRYAQLVSVMPVYPSLLSVNVDESNPDIPKTTYTGAVRVRVRILFRPSSSEPFQEVYRTSWIRLDN